MKPATIRAAIYARVSTDDQAADDKLSMPRQKSDCLAKCKDEGWEVVGVFEDPGISGTLIEERLGLVEFLALCQRGGVDRVVCRATDRLWRGEEASLQIRLILKAAGVGVWTLDRGEEPLGQPIEPVMAAMDVMLKEIVVQGLARGRRQAAEAGRWVCGKDVYGWRWCGEKKALVEVPAEQQAIRDIFTMYGEKGLGSDAVAERLNALDVPTPRAGKTDKDGRPRYSGRWTGSNVRYILGREVYATGVLHQFKSKRARRGPLEMLPKKGENGHEPGTWLPVKVKPIISMTLWRKVLNMRRRHLSQWCGGKRHQHLLSSFLTCGCCGGSMSGQGRGDQGKRTYYRCGRRHRQKRVARPIECSMPYLRGEPLEAAVTHLVRDWLEDGDRLAKRLERLVTTHATAQAEHEKRLKRHQERLRDIEFEIKRLVVALQKGILAENDVDGPYRAALKDKDLMAQEIAEERAAWEQRKENEKRKQAILDFAAEVRHAFDEFTDADWHDLFRALDLRLVVSPDGTISEESSLFGPRACLRARVGASPDRKNASGSLRTTTLRESTVRSCAMSSVQVKKRSLIWRSE